MPQYIGCWLIARFFLQSKQSGNLEEVIYLSIYYGCLIDIEMAYTLKYATALAYTLFCFSRYLIAAVMN